MIPARIKRVFRMTWSKGCFLEVINNISARIMDGMRVCIFKKGINAGWGNVLIREFRDNCKNMVLKAKKMDNKKAGRKMCFRLLNLMRITHF